jgi:hypothetical protein
MGLEISAASVLYRPLKSFTVPCRPLPLFKVHSRPLPSTIVNHVNHRLLKSNNVNKSQKAATTVTLLEGEDRDQKKPQKHSR